MEVVPLQLWIKLLCLGVALFACALYSFMETSITALRLFKIKQLSEKLSHYKALFIALEQDPHSVLITFLIANCLANVVAVDLITNLIGESFISLHISAGLSYFFGVTGATGAILFFGEIIPKGLAQSKSDRLFQSTLWIANGTFFLLKPLVFLLSRFSHLIINRIKPGAHTGDQQDAAISESEIQFLIDYVNKKGQMDTEKSKMLGSIFELADTSIKEIMVPEADMVSLNIESSMQEAVQLFLKYHFSRLPVYDGETDNIIGMMHQKDLFLLLSKCNLESVALRNLVRPILFVPENMKVNQLLHQFKQLRHHIAIVLNEYGGVIGLVTLEDVLEEIVGDIDDEHESKVEHIIELEQGGWLVYAGVSLEELEQTFGITFEVEDAISLGGFLTERFQYLPKKGEQITYKNFVFQIQKATPKRIVQVLVFKLDAA